MPSVDSIRSVRPITETTVPTDIPGMSQHRSTCNLCGDLDGHTRPGRLGRYSRTCDACEARRGAHLVPIRAGYANRDVAEAATV